MEQVEERKARCLTAQINAGKKRRHEELEEKERSSPSRFNFAEQVWRMQGPADERTDQHLHPYRHLAQAFYKILVYAPALLAATKIREEAS